MHATRAWGSPRCPGFAGKGRNRHPQQHSCTVTAATWGPLSGTVFAPAPVQPVKVVRRAIQGRLKVRLPLAPKRDVPGRLPGSRQLLTDAMAHHRGSGEPNVALNEIAVACRRHERVVRALKDCFVEKRVVNPETLIREMAIAACSSLDGFDDEFLETPFAPGGNETARRSCSEWC